MKYQSEKEDTPAGAPEPLTEDERGRLEWEMSDEDDAPDGPSTPLVRKLLALHDHLQARCELLDKLATAHQQEKFAVMRENAARIDRIQALQRQIQSLAAERDEWARRAKQSL